MTLKDKSILLVISGGIAAYKSLELIRLLRKDGASVRCILTKGGEQFVTPLSVSALSEHQVYTDLWSLKDESEMGHIRLSREADLIVIAPASADLLSKMANGCADDLASTTLLAADKKIIAVPAMNHKMWDNPATQRNVELLKLQGIMFAGPVAGDMACGEFGVGRMIEPGEILLAIQNRFGPKALSGFKALVTAGPTFEPLDPVRFIGNRSSGKQGYAIAEALADQGAEVTLISGPSSLPRPGNVTFIAVETADHMLAAALENINVDIAICTAAVSDWKAASPAAQKIKKSGAPPALNLTENPDILKTIANHPQRPQLVIGFAAETENAAENGVKKLKSKGCDWILADHVGDNSKPVFGSDENEVILIISATSESSETWPRLSKREVANILVKRISSFMQDRNSSARRDTNTNIHQIKTSR